MILQKKKCVVFVGDTTDNPFWDFVRDFLKKPSPEQLACQHPKPILLDTGEVIITTIPVFYMYLWLSYNTVLHCMYDPLSSLCITWIKYVWGFFFSRKA